MGYIPETEYDQIRTMLEDALHRPVHLVLFTSRDPMACEYCQMAEDLLTELSALHADLRLSIHDIEDEGTMAVAYGVDKTPALLILGGDRELDYGLRFYGLPSGYEFTSLMEAIRLVGQDEIDLAPAVRSILTEVTSPLHLQVFVTPTCPYCPRAALQAYRMAYASPQITADVIEVAEFPDLGSRYAVMGVPHTVIDEAVHIQGAVPDGMFLERLKEALGSSAMV